MDSNEFIAELLNSNDEIKQQITEKVIQAISNLDDEFYSNLIKPIVKDAIGDVLYEAITINSEEISRKFTDIIMSHIH